MVFGKNHKVGYSQNQRSQTSGSGGGDVYRIAKEVDFWFFNHKEH